MTDKELQERMEAIRRQSQRDVKNLKAIYHRNPRPKIKSVRDLFIYYFDILFGELFFEDNIPYLKLGVLPHCSLLLVILLAYDQDYQLMSLVLLLYVFQLLLILIMGLLVKHMMSHSFPSDSDD
ncbi:MAG: hypothetical protein E7156_03100 [Streptococcus gallolyticus]|uniref:Uncharacterized protein n=1 Tax=Streptococcus gallolyticus TaxID=315405 RepID=A0A928A3S9_9STRE|nr:hypothetical protein [Streptococcus gallolyticus]